LELTARTLHEGDGAGPLLVLDEPLSLWGGTDPETGLIVEARHPQAGVSITGRVLALSSSRGSSSSASVLAEQIRAGVGPAAILLGEPDAILVLGALVAAELYGRRTPVVELSSTQLRDLPRDGLASVHATELEARVSLT
jgi:predicted aconitase with swiveling domain